MNTIFSRARLKKKRRSSTNDIRSEATKNVYLGPKRRSSQDTLVFNRYDPSQEHYGQLANNLSEVNRTLNTVLRDVMNSGNNSPSIGSNTHTHTYDYDSDDTAASIDSLQISGFKIFGKSIDDYNAKRNMPIVSLTLKAGQLVFPSQQSVDHFKKSHKWKFSHSSDRRSSSSTTSTSSRINATELRSVTSNEELGQMMSSSNSSAIVDDDQGTIPEYEEDSNLPLFHLSTPPLAQFRKNCPYMIISKYYSLSELRERRAAGLIPDEMEEPTKYSFCKVYDKYIKSGVKRFTLEFCVDPSRPNNTFKIVMFTHRSKPYTDTIYKGTKLRFVGTSVCTSVFGSSAIQLMIMNEPNAISLLDGMTNDDKPAPDNPLLKEETTLTDISGGAINYKLYGNSTLPPLAKYSDNGGDIFPRKFNKLGNIFCYESIDLRNRDEVYGDYNNVKQVKMDTLVLTCMMLVLREQENKKNPRALNSQFSRGIPYYSAGSAPGLYGSYDSPFPLGNMW